MIPYLLAILTFLGLIVAVYFCLALKERTEAVGRKVACIDAIPETRYIRYQAAEDIRAGDVVEVGDDGKLRCANPRRKAGV